MLALLLIALQAQGAGSIHHGRAGQLEVRPPRIEASVAVNGRLDEPVWREAALLTGFSQYRPVDGRPAEDSTEIRVWYAPDAIWFGIRAFEAHGDQIRATLADRDAIDADDQVQILLDTFNDRRRALMFAVNPLGVQQDGVRSEGQEASAGGVGAGFRFDGVVDRNPDFAFQSAGHVLPDGYEVEIRIPFKSLRYQGGEPQAWGLQVVRITQHSRYEDTWTPVLRANASCLVQAGRLTDLTGLRRGLVLDVTPEFTTRLDGAPAAAGYEYDATPDLGGTARWGITQNLTLGATANPDFSQVEADVGQVTLNERFELFYPEKRPFFLEGLEQFDTPGRLIYTRRIADPIGGAKVTGKVGATGIGYLLAADDASRSATGDTPLYNLLRVRRDLGTSSNVGFAYTDRIDGSAYNRVAGADVRLVWRKIWFSDAQIAGSWTNDGGGVRRGLAWSTTLYDRTGRSYGNHLEIAGVHPDFRADAGFVNRTDVVDARIVLGAVASRPVESDRAAAVLKGQRLTAERIAEAAAVASELAKPMDNTDFELVWRKGMVRRLVSHALHEIRGDDIVYRHFVHLGVAVGTERGLVVPVVHHADRLTFADLEREIGRVAGLARTGKLSLDDLSGGTFSISNGGVYGSLMSTPILNPPQSGVLGMHKIQQRPMVVGGEVRARPMMYLALTYDHRIIDGREAVTFLVRVKECIEDPERLLLEV